MSLQKPIALISIIEDILPQTQCGQCGYAGCTPYANALVYNNEAINRCPPGGSIGIKKLTKILNKPPLALNQSCGLEKSPRTVQIQEHLCIGCTKCIVACPVDAIIGLKKQMHTIIETQCTGCELCLPACPMECITIKPIINSQQTTQQAKKQLKHYYLAKKTRENKQKSQKANHVTVKKTLENLQQDIFAALQRTKKNIANDT